MHNVKWSSSSKRRCVTQQFSFEQGLPGPRHLPHHYIWCQGPFYRRDAAVCGAVLHKHMRCNPCWWGWGRRSQDCRAQYVRLVRSGSALPCVWQLHISCHPTCSRQVTYLEFCLSSELVKKKCCFLYFSFFKLVEDRGGRIQVFEPHC